MAVSRLQVNTGEDELETNATAKHTAVGGTVPLIIPLTAAGLLAWIVSHLC